MGNNVTQPQIDIEWIVQEVIRRLRANEKTKPAGTQRVAESLELSERVITLSTLEKRISGVRRVVVSQRAVVTPAVIDELRDRKITLVRGSSELNSNGHESSRNEQLSRPLAVVTVDNFDAGALAKLLGSEIAVQNHGQGDGEGVLNETIAHVQNNNLAVLLTDVPVTAVVTANRDPRVRAAIGYSFPAVRQAVDEAGANLLAIDPRGRSVSELAGMINEFVQRTQ